MLTQQSYLSFRLADNYAAYSSVDTLASPNSHNNNVLQSIFHNQKA